MKQKFLLFGLVLLGLTQFSSCSSDEDLLPGDQVKGKEVQVSITVSRGGDNTRTLLTEDKTNGGLNDVWVAGDKLTIFNAAGEKAGELTLKAGEENKSEAVFTGTVEVGTTDGNYRLWYFGKPSDNAEDPYPYLDFESRKANKEFGVLLNEQAFKTPADLSGVDLMTAPVEIYVEGNEGFVKKNVTMNPQLAMARFTLSGLPAGTTGDLKFVNVNKSETGSTLYKRFFSNGGGEDTATFSSSNGGGLTVKNVKAGEDVYLAFVPGVYKFAVSVTTNNGVYTYEFKNPSTLEAGYYYSAFAKEEGAAEGIFAGVPIELIDHSKNPLLKWATKDLMTSDGTSGANAVNTFTEGYTTSGDFYQFGRNQGWMNYTLINGSNYNAKTACAKIDDNWAGNGEYYTTCYFSQYGNVNTSYLKNPYRGAGDAVTSPWYISTSTISKFPERFLFAGGPPFGDLNGDYVFDADIQKNQDWETRAKYCGYTKPVCPDGYRLPTLEDWRKILPKGDHVYSKGATTDFAPFSEIKKDGNITYAIRWSRVVSSTNNQYLKIEALVVPSSVTTTDNIDWNDENVKELYFKASGLIKPSFFLAKLNYNGNISYQWVARAQPLCKFSYTYAEVYTGSGYAASTKITINRDDTKLGGYYWVDDPNQYAMSFRFDPNNYQKEGSFIKVAGFSTPDACNIRCVKIEEE